MAKEERAVACNAKPERKPREKKPVIVERLSKPMSAENGTAAEWASTGEETFTDTAEAKKWLADKCAAAGPAGDGTYRIVTVQCEVTARTETVNTTVLE